MNIAVCSLATNNIRTRNYIDYVLDGQKKYCESYGYDYINYEYLIDESIPAQWNKILIIKKILPHYDWIMWIDADAIIMNHNVKLESIIDNNYDLIVNKVYCSELFPKSKYNINTGVFLIRNCDWSIDFLDNVFYDDNQFANNKFLGGEYEQGSFREYLNKVDPDTVLLKEDSYFNKYWPQEDLKLIDILNNFDRYKGYYYGIINNRFFSKGDFILHLNYLNDFGGIKDKEELYKIFSEYIIWKNE